MFFFEKKYKYEGHGNGLLQHLFTEQMKCYYYTQF